MRPRALIRATLLLAALGCLAAGEGDQGLPLTLSNLSDVVMRQGLPQNGTEDVPYVGRAASVVSLRDQKIMLDTHNNERRAVSPAAVPPLPALVWDENEAMEAMRLAKSCVFSHSRAGQNLAAWGSDAFKGFPEEGTAYISRNVSGSLCTKQLRLELMLRYSI
jgi:hypothetical protein